MNISKIVRSAKCGVLGALVAMGMTATAAEPEAVQLWEGGPLWATVNVGTSEVQEHPEYGGLYKFNDDAAKNAAESLGDGWRLPTKEEFDQLTNATYCTSTWDSDKKGRTFTGVGDYSTKSIFLPAASCDIGGGRVDGVDEGIYWSSAEKDADNAWGLDFLEDCALVNNLARSYGLSVRAVRDTPLMKVDKVKTATHWPWDGKIDVSCDLAGSGKVQLSAALTTNGVKVCDAKAANITGATEIDLDAVGGVTNDVKFTWNAKADCPADFNSTDAKVKVSVKKIVPPPAD